MRKFVCFKENGCQNSYFQNFYNDYIKQVFAVFKINHVVFASSNHLFIAFTELSAYINLQIKSSHKNVLTLYAFRCITVLCLYLFLLLLFVYFAVLTSSSVALNRYLLNIKSDNQNCNYS